jgi:hypothetical protein
MPEFCEAVMVNHRGEAAQMPKFGMRCNAQEIPEPMSTAKPLGWWIALAGSFAGSVGVESDGSDRAQVRPIESAVSVAVAVTRDRVLGICKPDSRHDPAVWFAASIPPLTVNSFGSQGILRKRPTEIRLGCDDWNVTLSGVSRYFSHSKSHQTGQEASLLKALQQTMGG